MGRKQFSKNNSYFKRYQVKFRRRRECKTDYKARRRLIQQEKSKYSAQKYRLVVRRSNRDIICQIFASDLTHDRCIAAAYSHELRNYGINFGLTNYAAAYATGLLLARRVNHKFKLTDYKGVVQADGEEYTVEQLPHLKKKPFSANLDIGLSRSCTGARVYGAMKGCVDGGLRIPHSSTRFPGNTMGENEEGEPEIQFDPDVLRKYIFGGHVKEHMEFLEREDPDKLAAPYYQYNKYGVAGDKLEELYAACHAEIRKDPFKKNPNRRGYFCADRDGPKPAVQKQDFRKQKKLSAADRRKNAEAKILELRKQKAQQEA